MTGRTWKPGDNGLAHPTRLAVFCYSDEHNDGDGHLRWLYTDGSSARVDEQHMRDVRPLVLIDPEDREAVQRLLCALRNMDILDTSWDEGVAHKRIATALRSLLTPPRKSLWERFDDARGVASTGDPINSNLTEAAWAWFTDRLGDQDVIKAFKAAWHEADNDGASGARVSAGLAAVAEAVRQP